ncbi:UDP-N-acetyl glucosamine 2-epimerase [Paractinoplanes abujensis]|uniref:UDP-N-acetylglucosamine 2-epimerase (Non-hydrolyzing) n=1 Tax=Paractinoplanes abujensis TaxID=882441 RepID=A0A7W7CX39_9ACTN|nr:UDP-N-acetylglucosamine 2-epimerase [Actinoplanes abujensis]MBB4696315.1 UDP-N-acetylglucosamine 2-epimerase (non-hydrolyzing) [Actinoplanes abujensis]GID22306.1 UDP-N-acetyl glucosamine 2-epimerase [Actinoplanes abujensis]
MSLPEVHLVAGTPAEAVRLAPVALAMREQGRLTPIPVATGTDPDTVGTTLAAFGLTPKITLPAGADDTETMRRFDELWAARTPAAVVVRDGLAPALAAFWRRVPIMTIDAGRRSGELGSVSALESQRRMLAQITTVHLAATPLTAMNLLDERVIAGDTLLTGGTAQDAAQLLAAKTIIAPPRERRTIVLGLPAERAEAVAPALRYLGGRYPDLEVVRAAGTAPGLELATLLTQAYALITDDEDLVEEALAAYCPVLMIGMAAQHGEALLAGSARLVEPDPAAITGEVASLLETRVRRDAMALSGNPYGDGLAAYRVAQATAALLGHGQFPDPMPAKPVAGVAR